MEENTCNRHNISWTFTLFSIFQILHIFLFFVSLTLNEVTSLRFTGYYVKTFSVPLGTSHAMKAKMLRKQRLEKF